MTIIPLVLVFVHLRRRTIYYRCFYLNFHNLHPNILWISCQSYGYYSLTSNKITYLLTFQLKNSRHFVNTFLNPLANNIRQLKLVNNQSYCILITILNAYVNPPISLFQFRIRIVSCLPLLNYLVIERINLKLL